jgi:lysophospholipase L1-like esterase
MPVQLTSKSKLLLIGDSITDAGRFDDKEHLGNGYVRLICDYLYARDPANAPLVVNQGISGHRVTDLAARWDNDVLAEKPDVLSIKIGINDVWHGLAGGAGGIPIDRYTAVYADLLTQVKNKLPRCQLVLCEPSVIWPPAPADGNAALQPYVKAVADLAKRFNAASLVPLHSAFEKARAARPDIVWAPDGVHPSSAGHMLIARTWLASAGLL